MQFCPRLKSRRAISPTYNVREKGKLRENNRPCEPAGQCSGEIFFILHPGLQVLVLCLQLSNDSSDSLKAEFFPKSGDPFPLIS